MALTFTPGVSEVVGTASQLSGALSEPVTATQGGVGVTSVGLNQTPVGNGSGAYALSVMGERMIAYSTALVVSASGDNVLTMSNAANLGAYVVSRVTWGLPVSSALATAIIVATVRTAAGGGGSAITGALVVTGLSATTAYLDQVVTLASAVTTSSQLYVNVTVAAAAPSSQMFIWGRCLGV